MSLDSLTLRTCFPRNADDGENGPADVTVASPLEPAGASVPSARKRSRNAIPIYDEPAGCFSSRKFRILYKVHKFPRSLRGTRGVGPGDASPKHPAPPSRRPPVHSPPASAPHRGDYPGAGIPLTGDGSTRRRRWPAARGVSAETPISSAEYQAPEWPDMRTTTGERSTGIEPDGPGARAYCGPHER